MKNFAEAVADRHQYARDWKARTGGKVIGYLCTYTPEEVIYAAGALPVRVLGGHEPQSVTEPHIYNMYCSLCRDVLGQGLMGRYDYLDGLVLANSCTHMSQVFDSWQRHRRLPFHHMLYMPANVFNPSAATLFADEVRRFRAALEKWLGQPISAEALREAIQVYNTNRRLLRQLYDLRRADSPPLSGAEVLPIVVSSMLMDKREHTEMLSRLLKRLPRRRNGAGGVRVLTYGSENDDPELVGLIESLGAAVVVDDQCAGSRYFWNQVPDGDDPEAAIARRYLERPPCPQKDLEGKKRIPHLMSLVDDYRVKGAIFLQQKFCDPHAYDAPSILGALKEKGIPSLSLEYDVVIPAGQFRTRIEAFLEMLGAMEEF
ncbi:MAG: 2-hydroxyacyl-CoA dehydratase [Chloroflexota bacterium]